MSEMLTIIHLGVKFLYFTGPVKLENKCTQNTVVDRPSETIIDFLIPKEKMEGRRELTGLAKFEI